MKVQTIILSGKALAWAVAKCEGWSPYECPGIAQVWLERGRDARDARILKSLHELDYSTNWDISGPIIEREKLMIQPKLAEDGHWYGDWRSVCLSFEGRTHSDVNGATALEAAMRCRVLSQLGCEVDIPDELLML